MTLQVLTFGLVPTPKTRDAAACRDLTSFKWMNRKYSTVPLLATGPHLFDLPWEQHPYFVYGNEQFFSALPTCVGVLWVPPLQAWLMDWFIGEGWRPVVPLHPPSHFFFSCGTS